MLTILSKCYWRNRRPDIKRTAFPCFKVIKYYLKREEEKRLEAEMQRLEEERLQREKKKEKGLRPSVEFEKKKEIESNAKRR